MEFNTFIDDLIKNVNINNVPTEIDLVLDGGAFNGGYQLGALMYLKQMERNNIIKIKRISGASIGAVLGFLFIIDDLEYALKKNHEIWKDFRNNFSLSILREMIIELIKSLDKDIYKRVNKKLFITYFNVNKKKQIVKSKYRNNKQVISSLIKSSFVPYFIDGNYTYKNKYVDGVYPYLFESNFGVMTKRKKLFICLSSIKHSKKMLSIKNEINGHERILYGINDINNFFKNHYQPSNSIIYQIIGVFELLGIINNNSTLCSYINNWRFFDWINFKSKYFFIIMIIYIIEFKYRIEKNFYNFNQTDSILLRENYKNIIEVMNLIKKYSKLYINYAAKTILT